MTTSTSAGMGSDAQRQIIDRAMKDPDFRTRLVQNPQAAIQEGLGTSISPTATIRVIEEQPGEVVLVLPAHPIESGDILSDEDLEEVAGGTCSVIA
jgi:hypothetical protein